MRGNFRDIDSAFFALKNLLILTELSKTQKSCRITNTWGMGRGVVPDPRPRTGGSFHIAVGGGGMRFPCAPRTHFCKKLYALLDKSLPVIDWDKPRVSFLRCDIYHVSSDTVPDYDSSLNCHKSSYHVEALKDCCSQDSMIAVESLAACVDFCIFMQNIIQSHTLYKYTQHNTFHGKGR